MSTCPGYGSKTFRWTVGKTVWNKTIVVFCLQRLRSYVGASALNVTNVIRVLFLFRPV